MKVFTNAGANNVDIFESGNLCILALYGALEDLNTLRYKSLIKAISKNSCVNLASLVPTHDAAVKNIRRVYLQVQLWRPYFAKKHRNGKLIVIYYSQLQ